MNGEMSEDSQISEISGYVIGGYWGNKWVYPFNALASYRFTAVHIQDINVAY